MRTLQEDGIAKAALGLTTLEEVWHVAPRLETRRAQVRSVPGPAAPPSPRPAGAAPGAAPPTRAATPPRILVLEDDADTQVLLQRYLDQTGYTVTLAQDGIEALLHLGQQPFDLILSDITMPISMGSRSWNSRIKKVLRPRLSS